MATKPKRTRDKALIIMMTESEKSEIQRVALAKKTNLSVLIREYIITGIESDRDATNEYYRARESEHPTI